LILDDHQISIIDINLEHSYSLASIVEEP